MEQPSCLSPPVLVQLPRSGIQLGNEAKADECFLKDLVPAINQHFLVLSAGAVSRVSAVPAWALLCPCTARPC